MREDADTEPSVHERLEALERRLAALEARNAQEPTGSAPVDAASVVDAVPVHSAPAGLDPDRFWALTGLRERIGTRSAVLFTGSVSLPRDRSYVWQEGVDADALAADDWGDAAAALAALGHPIRLRVLQQALGGAGTTAELGATEGIRTSGQLYHHLRELVAAGWLTAAARGRYEVPAARVIPLLVTIAAARS